MLSFLDRIFGYVANVETTKITTQAAVEEEAIKGTSAVEQRWWFVSAMIPAFALPYAVWTWKAVVWDKIVEGGHTRTDALTGPLGWAYVTIIGGIFMHSLVNR